MQVEASYVNSWKDGVPMDNDLLAFVLGRGHDVTAHKDDWQWWAKQEAMLWSKKDKWWAQQAAMLWSLPSGDVSS